MKNLFSHLVAILILSRFDKNQHKEQKMVRSAAGSAVGAIDDDGGGDGTDATGDGT